MNLMSRPRKWESDAQRRQAQNDRRRAERQAARVPRVSRETVTRFVAVDGEGTGRGSRHRYVLLGAGDAQIEDSGGLGLLDIFTFLYEQYRFNKDTAFCGFFLGYDFTQWLKHLPERKAYLLFHPEERARRPLTDKKTGEIITQNNPLGPFPVRWSGWEFDILGMKRFKLRPEGCRGWLSVCDSGPFFQASLLSVIDPRAWDEPVVTDDEYHQIKEGKENRDKAVLDDDMRFYNRLENRILAERIMPRMDSGFRKAGIRLAKDQWFGPGQAAQTWLGNSKIPDREMVRAAVPVHGANGDILGKGRLAYYGGWFEIFAHGHIPGVSWEYDINSAYPYIIAALPCLLHGRWVSDDSDIRLRESGHIRLVYASVYGSDPRVGAMLHRRPDGSILRPSATRGWYWESELVAAQAAGLIDRVEISEGARYVPCSCPPPLRGVSGLYDARLRVGKNTPEGKSYKLVYNSMYGKFAQSIGEPRFGNSLYASLITSGCRGMICDAIATHPRGTDDVLMVATDGVYFRSQHPSLAMSEKLGNWEESSHQNLTLFKPGVYWDDTTREAIGANKDPKFKARGISARYFGKVLGEVDRQFSEGASCVGVEFKTGFSMITCLQALQRNDWSLAGRVNDDVTLTQNSDPVEKRHGIYRSDGIYWSRPYQDGGAVFESTPYSKDFGSPDEDEYGITDDGSVKDTWAAVLK